MGNVKMDSNGRIGEHEPITMRILHREVHSDRAHNAKIMKAQKKILNILNMLHRKVNKYCGTKKVDSARHVAASKSHSIRDEHGNDRQSRNMRRQHHSPKKYSSKSHAILGPGCISSVSPVRSVGLLYFLQ
jgi:hypothetical protein